jgi:hypothetical protein
MDSIAPNPVATPEANDQPRPATGSRPRSEWTWILLVGLFLGLSGSFRYWREWRFQALSKESESSPFPLEGFPKDLGEWQSIEGLETKLDPLIARIAGSKDHLIRTYQNRTSGESVVVMILYGLAEMISSHTPEVCYPSAGYKNVPPTRDFDVPIPGSTEKASFREELFIKYSAGAAIHERVYHSFRNAGQWTPDMQSRWKAFRYHPGMFKIQVARRDSGDARRGDAEFEAFLARMVAEIDRRLVPARRVGEKGSTPPVSFVSPASRTSRRRES